LNLWPNAAIIAHDMMHSMHGKREGHDLWTLAPFSTRG
jgi:hypothetical protein